MKIGVCSTHLIRREFISFLVFKGRSHCWERWSQVGPWGCRQMTALIATFANREGGSISKSERGKGGWVSDRVAGRVVEGH